MASLAGDFITCTTSSMAAYAVFIINFGAKCMVVADCTIAFSNFLMQRMVKKDRFIELGQGINYNLIRSITGLSNSGVQGKAQQHCHDCTQQMFWDSLHFFVTSFWLIFYNLLNLFIIFSKKAWISGKKKPGR
jgi:hypothetical protein